MITLTFLLILIMGSANFAAHRAMLESGHPAVMDALAPLRSRFGQYITYVLEFTVLVAALTLEHGHPIATLSLYGLYTMFNILAAAWLHHQD